MSEEVRSLESGESHKGEGIGNEPQPHCPADCIIISSLSSSSSMLRIKKPSEGRCGPFHRLLANIHQVLGTKLSPLLLAVPLAAAAKYYHLSHAWVFSLSLLGLVPLAERMSFLSEQITYYTSETVGGLLNATCGNVPELIIALLALQKDKIGVLKWSLLGSILSNMLLVLGSSLLFGGLYNRTDPEQPFARKNADVSMSLLLLSVVCHILALMHRHVSSSLEYAVGTVDVLELSRFFSIIMLVAYCTYIFFQLKTNRQSFQPQEDECNDIIINLDAPVIGFMSAIVWLIGTTIAAAVLSDLVVGTIEAASESMGMSVSFISVILLPLGGNAAEHASAIIFAVKNKIDITLGVTLGSATQISMFMIPLTVVVAWIKGIRMDLDFKLLETGSYFLAILLTAFILRDGTWQYMKGAILLFGYFVISSLFFVLRASELLVVCSQCVRHATLLTLSHAKRQKVIVRLCVLQRLGWTDIFTFTIYRVCHSFSQLRVL